jgi:hypothetical protein
VGSLEKITPIDKREQLCNAIAATWTLTSMLDDFAAMVRDCSAASHEQYGDILKRVDEFRAQVQAVEKTTVATYLSPDYRLVAYSEKQPGIGGSDDSLPFE